MLYYRCAHCGKRVERGKSCTCSFKRDYSKPEGTRKLYHTARWQKLQATILARYDGMDPYAYVCGRIEHADTVHHILIAEDHPELFWVPDNLIPVSRHSHDEIHVQYRQGAEARDQVTRLLQSLVKSVSDEL